MTASAEPGLGHRTGPRRRLPRRLVAVAGTHPAVLGAIVLLALVLRLPHLTQPLVDSFSWREASTAMMADNFRTGGWNIFFPEVNWSGPGPSYQGREFQLLSYITALLHAAFGWHDWIGRAVALGFGLLTLVSLHRLAAAIWDERHAHAVAGAYAVMPAAIAIDTSFLPDPSMLGLLTLGLWLYVRWWSGGREILLWLGAAAFTLGVLCKIPGLSAGFAVVWLIGVLFARGERARAVRSLLACGIGLAVIVAYYAWAIHLGTSYPPYHVAGSGYIWDEGVAAFLGELFFIDSAWNIAVWWYYGWPLLALMAVGLWFWPGGGEFGRDGALRAVPIAWGLGAVAVYAAGAKEITANPWNLHMFHVPLAFLIGRGGLVLLQAGRSSLPEGRLLLRVALIVAVILVGAIVPLLGSIKQPRAEWGRLLGERVAELRAADDLAILVSPEVGDPIAIYYSRGRGWTLPPGGGEQSWSLLYEDDASAIAALEALKAEGAVWFGVTRDATDKQGRRFVNHHASLIEHLMQTATLVEYPPEFLLWRLEPDPA